MLIYDTRSTKMNQYTNNTNLNCRLLQRKYTKHHFYHKKRVCNFQFDQKQYLFWPGQLACYVDKKKDKKQGIKNCESIALKSTLLIQWIWHRRWKEKNLWLLRFLFKRKKKNEETETSGSKKKKKIVKIWRRIVPRENTMNSQRTKYVEKDFTWVHFA